jgi:ABC-type uncharacterized transport system ATPase component
MADDDRGRSFETFQAETRLELAHLREAMLRLLPIHEQRSGDRAEMAALQRDVHEITKDVAAVGEKVDKLTDGQRRMVVIVLALQGAAVILMWLLNAGVIRFGGAP